MRFFIQFIVRLFDWSHPMKPLHEMQTQISQAVRLVRWNERLLTLLGIWPLDLKDTRFAFNVSYLAIVVVLEYADLFQNINSLEHVVDNLSENITYTTIVLKVIFLRLNHRKLKTVVEAVMDDFREESYKNSREKRVFLTYYVRARRFFRVEVSLVGLIAMSYYLVPIADLMVTIVMQVQLKWILAAETNGTVPLNLPYHTHMFYDVSKTHVYAMTYAAQLPFVFISFLGHTGADCLIVTLMLHICGQLSLLVERINDLNTDHRECGQEIGKLVRMHVRLISMSNILAEAYNVILSIQLLGAMVLVCILSYNLLANAEEGQAVDFVNFLLYISGVVLLIFIYCFIGESLIEESTKVHQAFSNCRWNEMSTQCAKSIIICMARSQEPLVLRAGNYYTFSLHSFSAIMKTSFTYLSVLKSLL